MFTLKLYRHRTRGDNARFLETRILEVHHVDSCVIGEHTVKIDAYDKAQPDNIFVPHEEFYIGERKPEMTAIQDHDHWEWALLENANGRTTEHFRPHTYG